MDSARFEPLLTKAITARFPLFDPQHQMRFGAGDPGAE